MIQLRHNNDMIKHKINYNDTMKNVQQYLKKLKKIIHQDLKDQVLESRLFGSYARGEAGQNSDIDVLLVAKNKQLVSDKVGDFVIDTLIQGGPYFSIKIFDQKKFNKLNNLKSFFIRQLERDAVNL